MVLVSMGDKNAPDLALIFNKVADIGNDHVDTVHVIVREAHAAVHDYDVPAVLVRREVLADLIETAQRNNLQFLSHNNSFTVI